MNYNSTRVIVPVPMALFPGSPELQAKSISAPATGAVGTQPPQSGQHYHAEADITLPTSSATPCATCNLIPIPFNPNLPQLRM